MPNLRTTFIFLFVFLKTFKFSVESIYYFKMREKNHSLLKNIKDVSTNVLGHLERRKRDPLGLTARIRFKSKRTMG